MAGSLYLEIGSDIIVTILASVHYRTIQYRVARHLFCILIVIWSQTTTDGRSAPHIKVSQLVDIHLLFLGGLLLYQGTNSVGSW